MKARMFLWPCLLLSGYIATASAAAPVETNDSSVKVKWSYLGSTGPRQWGMLSPAFEECDVGKAQAPINLGRKRVRVPYALKVDYRPARLAIGEEIPATLEIGASKTVINNGHGLQINFHQKGSKEVITYDGDQYALDQVHFHSPSETLWHKQSFPLEIHFVHQGKDGKVAILAVFVKAGNESAALKTILDNSPKEAGRVYNMRHVSIHPSQLLPTDQRYFAYNGSLTTPPCTQGLQWIVMPTPITASPAQILRIRQKIAGNNARPVQAMNNRVLSYAVPN